MIDVLKKGKKEVDKLKVAMQNVAFPGIVEGLNTAIGLIPTFKKQFLGSATVIGKAGKEIPQAFADAAPEIGRIWDSTNGFFSTLVDLVGQIIKSAAIVIDAARPIIDYFTVANLQLAGWIKNSTEGGDNFKKMQDYFVRVLDTVRQWGRILWDTFRGVLNIFKAGSASGDKMTDSIELAMEKFRAWTDDPENQGRLAKVFENGRKALGVVMQIIGAIGVAIGHIVEGPGFEAVGGLIQRITGAKGTSGGGGAFAGLTKFIEWLGTDALVKGVNMIHGILDVFQGKKKPSGFIEKAFSLIQKIGDLDIKPDILVTTVDILGWLIEKVQWFIDKVPGAKKIIAGILALLVIKRFAKKSGLLGVMSGFKDGYKSLSGLGTSNKRVINGLRDVRQAICDPTSCAHPPTTTFLEGLEKKGANFGKKILSPFKKGWGRFTDLFKKKIPTPQIPAPTMPKMPAAALDAGQPSLDTGQPRLPATAAKPPLDLGAWDTTGRETGRDFSAGIGKGIESYEPTLTSKAKGVAQSAINSFKSVLRIKSPSAVMYDLGRDTARGYVLGMESVSTSSLSRIPTETARAAETGAARAGKTKSKWQSFRKVFKWGNKRAR